MVHVVRVKKVTILGRPNSVADITVEGNSNLFASSKLDEPSILAHNCARDDPMNTFEVVGGTMSDETKTLYFDKMAVWDKHFSVVQNVGRAKKPKLEDIRILVEEKPCCDEEDYQRVYGDPYSGCPLAGGGTCFSQKKLNKVLKETWDEWCT